MLSRECRTPASSVKLGGICFSGLKSGPEEIRPTIEGSKIGYSGTIASSITCHPDKLERWWQTTLRDVTWPRDVVEPCTMTAGKGENHDKVTPENRSLYGSQEAQRYNNCYQGKGPLR